MPAEESESDESSLTAMTKVEEPITLFKVDRWSSFLKATRVVAWVRRFIQNARNQNITKGNLSQQEMEESKIILYKHSQKLAFPEEVARLKHGNDIQKNSKLYMLNPYVDEKGLLRVKSRLEMSNLTYAEKFPIIMDNGWLSRLIAEEKHKTMKHAGVGTIVTSLRNDFWIIGLRRLVKGIISRCFMCQKLSATSCNQPSPPLPMNRVVEDAPFSKTGIDYAGPLYVSDYPHQKFYFCLFTCTIIRAIHLEITNSLSSRDFVLAFRRFSSRRGVPDELISDNAKTFKGAQPLLLNLYASECPKWSYISPRSPWRGGIWERLVRSVKNALKRSLGSSCLTRAELETILLEIEHVVNSRPLTQALDDIDSKKPLTPNHFLLGYLRCRDTKLKDRFKTSQKQFDDFWKFWASDYLRNLPVIVPQFVKKGTVKVNSLVLIQEDHIPRLKWPMGRVLELLPGKDGRVRTVRLQINKGVCVRPIQRLHLLELDSQKNFRKDPKCISEQILENTDRDEQILTPVVEDIQSDSNSAGPTVKESDKPTQPEPSTSRKGRVIKKPKKLDL